MKISFNTGRLYTQEGQVITAEINEDAEVNFVDHSRMIAGSFIAPPFRGDLPDPERRLARIVMSAYDHHEYRPTSGKLSRCDVVHSFKS